MAASKYDFRVQKFVYISGALTDMSEDERARLRSFYESLADVCLEAGFNAYLPHVYSDPATALALQPDQVDLLDRTAVTLSYLVIAYVGVPSFGVGIEVEMAHHAHKPVILLCEKEKLETRRVSRLVRGNPRVIQTIAFSDFADGAVQIRTALAMFKEAVAGSVFTPPLLP